MNDGTANQTELLRMFLAQGDVPCPSCGYNLRGLAVPHCPECNQELTLRVNLAEPRLGPFIGALSGLLAGAGASAVCLLLVAYFTVRWGLPSRREFFPVVVLPTLALTMSGSLALLLSAVRGRRWFRSLAPGSRRLLIAGCWLLTVAYVLCFAITVR